VTCRREATRPPPPSAAATPAGARPTPRFAEGATPTRDRLPAVAARLASEGGALAIGVEPVARAAGVGPGAVIRHVSGRDEGARALLAQVAEEVEADLAALTAWGLRFTGALIEATFAEVKERSGLLATLIAALAATRTSRHRSGGASRPGPAAWWRRTAWAGLRRRPCASPSTA
jgi:AcrR family transcriptional regulator